MCLQYILVSPPPLFCLIPPLTPSLEQFQQIALFCFHAQIQNAPTISALFHSFPCTLPLMPAPGQDLF
jgi:hypothetical protein